MSLVINHNMMAMNAARNLGDIYSRLSTSTRRLSSGLRVGSAGDDAAGLAIREQMRADIATINQGIRNASDAISMIQTAEGAMSVIDEKLTRMKELAEQAATGTYTTAQREIINSEYQAMAAEIDRIANATDFNGVKLLDGSLSQGHSGSGMKIHFGIGNDAKEDYYFINTGDVRATYASGLRVGNSDPRDTLRTTNLSATSAITPLEEGADNTADGFFGIRYSEDMNSENPTAGKWNLYGYVDIDASRTSINDIVQNINKGSQAQGTLSINAGSSALVKEGSITINGQIFTFSTGIANSTYTAGTTGTILLTDETDAAAINADIASFLNAHAASIGVYGAVNGTTLQMVAHEFGVKGNNIDVNSNTTVIKSNQKTLEDGGRKVLSAMAYYDEAKNEWQLQIQMNHGGEKYQVQTFSFASSGQSAATIMGGQMPGVAMTTSTGDLWMARLISASTINAVNGHLRTYSKLDEQNEWLQPQNGSGTTDWDGADVLTQSHAQKALDALDGAITKKDIARANLGAIQNRLENTITNLQIQAENLQAAESRISDVDVATEMTEFTRNNILAQAAVAMLAQANSLPQLALQLISG